MRRIEELLEIMARLRDPAGGCPWDRAQTFATIVPHTLEEAYEVADAIERGDLAALRDELGDLLFQVVFYAQMAREDGLFDFNDVVAAIADKLVRRHPHVFAEAEVDSAGGQSREWERHKAAERAARAAAERRSPSALDGVPVALPALTRAAKLQRRAARVGFDWAETAEVLDKLEEEIGELRAELARGEARERIRAELGDVLFALVNLARRLDIDAEGALRGTNAKFEDRFRHIEAALEGQGRRAEDAPLEELERLWQAAKRDHP